MLHTVREDYTHPELDWVGDDKLIFITAHRRENLGEPMHHMFRAIRRVLDEHPECEAVYPIHMNPIVRKAAEAELPGYTHNIINLSETENLVTVIWANEVFDTQHPDTFFEKV